MATADLGSMYQRLDPKEIVATTETLHQRIKERFPKRALTRVCEELKGTAAEAGRVADYIKKPNWGFRVTIGLVFLIAASALVGVLCMANVRDDLGGISDYIQGIQALAQILVYMGATVYFLFNIEGRRKHALVMKHINDLRSIAHVVDMHQLTKDPERLCNGHHDTASSPVRTMTPFELKRYLNYCSEMLAIVSKIATIYVQDLNDPTAGKAAGDIEDITTGLSRKIWQKINLIDHHYPLRTHQDAMTEPLPLIHILRNELSLCKKPSSTITGVEEETGVEHVTCDECLKAVPPEHLVLFCPACNKQHLDIPDGEIDWSKHLHRTHKCVNTPEGPNTGCGNLWRPKKIPTFGVASVST